MNIEGQCEGDRKGGGKRVKMCVREKSRREENTEKTDKERN